MEIPNRRVWKIVDRVLYILLQTSNIFLQHSNGDTSTVESAGENVQVYVENVYGKSFIAQRRITRWWS